MFTKLKAGRYMVPVTLIEEDKRITIQFGYNKALLEEIKQMDGAKYHGYDDVNPRKEWSVKNNIRNQFQLQYLQHPLSTDPLNPYRVFDAPIPSLRNGRPSYDHQAEMVGHIITRKSGIWAVEMGAGKSLAAIDAIELSKATTIWWVAPRSALVSVELEAIKWRCKVPIIFMTYEKMVKTVAEWRSGDKAPQFLIFDEASRLKNHTAKRTQAAEHLSNAVREEWGQNGYILLMSGTPSPKSPVDWWSLCNIACPGFLREGTPDKLRNTLAIIEQRESFTGGGVYPHLVTWRDDSKKCKVCGYFEADHSSSVDVFSAGAGQSHPFEASVNEIDRLYKRMTGLVYVKFKKDCLSLPDKIYRTITIKPKLSMLNAAEAIKARTPNAAAALVLLRELSDGFQYKDVTDGTKICDLCHGMRSVTTTDYGRDLSELDRVRGSFEDGTPLPTVTEEVECTRCNGTGYVDKISRQPSYITSPKEDVLKDLLDEYEDVGRLVIYGGFTATIDKIVNLVNTAGWKWIRIDGRGWLSNIEGATDSKKMVNVFQGDTADKIAVIGHPGSAGMGLTLTKSPAIFYYSNDFNAESRIQSEDRIHRAGMDVNRGATIIDVVHLASDQLIIDNLKKKRRLQDITMGELLAAQ